jgi:DNA invertase Pin-like site-specific DNA recombinase
MAFASLYLRASSDYQKYSTANQRDALTRYASEHDLQIVVVYEDDGRSGLSLEGRDGLRQLLQDVLSGTPGFEVLPVYDISRWGRFQDADESAHYECLCRRAGVRVVYCAEPFENDGSITANLLKANHPC